MSLVEEVLTDVCDFGLDHSAIDLALANQADEIERLATELQNAQADCRIAHEALIWAMDAIPMKEREALDICNEAAQRLARYNEGRQE